MRIINFFDGATSETTPTIGNIVASSLVQYPDDATFLANEQGSPIKGNIYFNTTSNVIRYYDGTTWDVIADLTTTQTLQNKTINGATAGNNTVLTTATNTEVTPSGNLGSTNAQAALVELQGDINGHNTRIGVLEAASGSYESTANKNQPNGYAGLDGTGKVAAAQLPSYVDDVVEYASIASFPVTGESGKIYVSIDTNKTWRWTGSIYVEISASPVTSVNGQTGVVVLNVNNLNNVVAPSPSNLEVLTYNTATSKWINSTVPRNIDGLSDVDTTTITPISGDSLVYNGTQWAPLAVAAGAANNPSPNHIINGSFETWQRGTSQSLTTDGMLADRFVVGKGGGTTLVQRNNDVPSYLSTGVATNYCHEMNTSVVAGGGATDYATLAQNIEGHYVYNFLLGTFTHSFWIKVSQTCTLSVSYRNASASQSYVTTFTVNAVSTWEKKTITIPAPTSFTGFSFDSGVGLSVSIAMGCGTTYQTATLNAWQSGNFIAATTQTQLHTILNANMRVTLCKIESGTTATKFVPFDGNFSSDLRACFRYYLSNAYWTAYTTWSGTSAGGTTYRTTGVNFPVLMRTTPTLTSTTTSNANFPAGSGFVDITSSGYREQRVAASSATGAHFVTRLDSANAEY